MPKLVRTKDSKHEQFQIAVKELGQGWSVQNHRGKVFLKLRLSGLKPQSVKLDFLWEKGSFKAAERRIEKIYNLTLEGHDLKTAANIAAGNAPQVDRDWNSYLSNFKVWKIKHDTNISDYTWKHDYLPVLKMAVALLEGKKAPSNSADLIDACIRDWETGSPARTRRTNNLCQFLSYCVERENVPVAWSPPLNRKKHIGRKSANAKSQKVDALTDEDILFLINGMPNTPAGARWVAAIMIMAVYGLRPVELKHLHVKTDKRTGKPYLWCSYEKRAGAGVTNPRKLDPLPVAGQNWNLLWRLQNDEIELPPLNGKAGVGDAALKYFKKRPAFKTLQEKLAKKEERIGSYSFRHSYSLRGHNHGIDSGSVADAMGHTLECHLRAYTWASSETRARAFEKARKLAITLRA